MRLIDADGFKDRMLRGANDVAKVMQNPELVAMYLDWIDGLVQDIDNQPTVYDMEKVSWIDVRKALPEDRIIEEGSDRWHTLKSIHYDNGKEVLTESDDVLVCHIGEFSNKKHVSIARLICGKWHAGICGQDEVVAWMPKPEPYEG